MGAGGWGSKGQRRRGEGVGRIGRGWWPGVQGTGGASGEGGGRVGQGARWGDGVGLAVGGRAGRGGLGGGDCYRWR